MFMSVIALLNIPPIMFATLKVSFTTYIVHKINNDNINNEKLDRIEPVCAFCICD